MHAYMLQREHHRVLLKVLSMDQLNFEAENAALAAENSRLKALAYDLRNRLSEAHERIEALDATVQCLRLVASQQQDQHSIAQANGTELQPSSSSAPGGASSGATVHHDISRDRAARIVTRFVRRCSSHHSHHNHFGDVVVRVHQALERFRGLLTRGFEVLACTGSGGEKSMLFVDVNTAKLCLGASQHDAAALSCGIELHTMQKVALGSEAAQADIFQRTLQVSGQENACVTVVGENGGALHFCMATAKAARILVLCLRDMIRELARETKSLEMRRSKALNFARTGRFSSGVGGIAGRVVVSAV